MRKITLDEIKKHLESKGKSIDYSVQLFRSKTKNDGWPMKRTRPRNSDEMKALNYISRASLRNAIREGKIQYDQERRMLILEQFNKRQKRSPSIKE